MPKTNDTQKVEKFLTEIKELPTYTEEEENAAVKPPVQSGSLKKKEQELKEKYSKNAESSTPAPLPKDSIDMNNRDDNEVEKILNSDTTNVKYIAGIPFTIRDLILNGINILTLILIFVIISKLNGKAVELKTIRNENLRLTNSFNYDAMKVEEAVNKAEEIEGLFMTESGIIDFVRDVENLDGEDGAIQGVTFNNPNPIQDRSKNYGLPIAISMQGNWEQISTSLERIDSLDYLFRPVVIKIERDEDDAGVINFQYGVLLYVKEPGKEQNAESR